MRVAYLLTLALLWPALTMAGLHKCTDADGSTRYSDQPCAADEAAEQRDMPGMDGALLGSGTLKIHHSWMRSPALLPADWQCEGQGCRCNGRHAALDSDPTRRLLDALGNLPNSWRNHQSGLDSWTKRGGAQSGRAAEAQGRVADSACQVAHHQWVIRQLHPGLTEALLEGHAYNQYVRQTLESSCRRPEETGWTQSEEAKEYVRCLDRTSSQRNEAVRAAKLTGGTETVLRRALSELGFPRSDSPP